MFPILIYLVWVLNCLFDYCLTPIHFRVFCYNMIVPSIAGTSNSNAILVLTMNRCHIVCLDKYNNRILLLSSTKALVLKY